MLIDGGEVGGGCPLLPDDDVVPPDDEAVDAVGDSTTGADAVDLYAMPWTAASSDVASDLPLFFESSSFNSEARTDIRLCLRPLCLASFFLCALASGVPT